jgi:hypothetical protein
VAVRRHREPTRDGPLTDTLLTLVDRTRLNEGDTGEGYASSARSTNCPRHTVPFKGCGWRKPTATGVGFGSEPVSEFIGVFTTSAFRAQASR